MVSPKAVKLKHFAPGLQQLLTPGVQDWPDCTQIGRKIVSNDFSTQKNLFGFFAPSGIVQIVPGTHGNPPVHSDPAQSCCPVGVTVGTVLGLNVGLTVGEADIDVGFTEGKAVGF